MESKFHMMDRRILTGRKLKTYQVSVVTFWVMVLMLPGRKLKKTYLNSESILHLEDSTLDGRKLLKTYLLSEFHLHGEELMLLGRKNKKTSNFGEDMILQTVILVVS